MTESKTRQEQLYPNISVINNIIGGVTQVGGEVIKDVSSEIIKIQDYIKEQQKKQLEEKAKIVRPSFQYDEIFGKIKEAITQKKNSIVVDENLLEPDVINKLIANNVITDIKEYQSPKGNNCFCTMPDIKMDHLLELNFNFRVI